MTSGFQPNWASAPGDTIRDLLLERGWSVEHFAECLGQPLTFATDLLEGRTTITVRTACNLAVTLGASVEFWMARDAQYRATTARLHAADQDWLAEFPLSDMVRFGWLNPAPRPSEEVSATLQFFGVRSVAEWHQLYGPLQAQVAFRTSRTFDSKPAAVAAWLRQGERQTASIDCAPWDAQRFETLLAEARRLTLERHPGKFLPRLQELCAAAGVAVAVVRAPTGCRASGATRFINAQRALLLLSFRYLSDDQFWFTFFHEAGHLLLHPQTKVFIEGLNGGSESQEVEANAFAERILIPAEFQQALLSLPKQDRAIVRFAKQIGVAPGIVVGQLQHHRRIPMQHFNGLKRRFEWS